MSDLTKTVVQFLGYVFIAVVLAFTSSQTWAILYETSQSWLVAGLGLAFFEGGMIYWWLVFQREATGLPQLAISLIVAILCLLAVAGAVALHLGAIQTDNYETITARLITAAALIHLAAKFAFPLLDPDRIESITDRAAEGRILKLAFQKFNARIGAIADSLANNMADEYTDQLQLTIKNRIAGRTHHQPNAPAILAAPPAEDETGN